MTAKLIHEFHSKETSKVQKLVSYFCNMAVVFLLSFPIELIVFFSVLLMFPFIIIAMHLTHCDV